MYGMRYNRQSHVQFHCSGTQYIVSNSHCVLLLQVVQDQQGMNMEAEKIRKPAGNRGQGRKAGVPNKVTTEFRATINRLLEDNSENFAKWLKQTAEGIPEHDIKPNPAKAMDIMSNLAEYAAPKLSRAEHVGDPENPLNIQNNLVVTFVKPK